MGRKENGQSSGVPSSSSSSSSSSSWLTRTNFRRTICYRTDTLRAAPLPLPPSLLLLPSFHSRKGGKSGPSVWVMPERWRDGAESMSGNDSDFAFSSPLSSSSCNCSPLSVAAAAAMMQGYQQSIGSASSSSNCFSDYDLGSSDSSSLHRGYSKTPSSASSSPLLNLSARLSADGACPWSEHFRRPGDEHPVLAAAEWMVDLSELFVGAKFACGASSRLYRGIYKNQDVAIKVIRLPEKDDVTAERFERFFLQEITLLSQLHHPNIVQFVAACKKPPALCVITEYLSGGSLKSFLSQRNGEPLPSALVVEMALDIAQGMEYIHSNGVIHRDLKSENLILTEGRQVKVTDFGTACLEEANRDGRDRDPGTYRWMAPEMIMHRHYSRKVDVYSFAIVLWELTTLKTPFAEMSGVQAAFAVVHKNARPPIPAGSPIELASLLQRCWAVVPEQRPEFREICTVLQSLKDS